MNVDVNDNIKPTDLVMCLQETANGQMHDRKPSYVEFFADNKSFIITRLLVEIYEQIHQFDKISVRTWTAGERGATFYRAYQVMRDGKCVALATGDWAVVDVQDGHIYRTSEIDLSNYESDEKPELSLPTRFRFDKDMEFHDAGAYTVQISDCDMNMHMNNTRYHDMLWNRIDGILDKEVTSINIRYKTEARCGDDIDVYVGKVTPEMAGDPNAEEVFGFRTLTRGKSNVEALIGVRSIPEDKKVLRKKLEDL